MPSRSPERVDPWRFADRGGVLKGRFPLAALPRVAPLLASTEGDADYELAFSRDAKGRPVITGRVDTLLSLVCQRCLGPVELKVASHFAVTVVTTIEETRDLDDVGESLLLEEPTLNTRDLVDEELLLNIPAVPRHESCSVATEWPATGAGKEEDAGSNPFDVLAALRDRNRNN